MVQYVAATFTGLSDEISGMEVDSIVKKTQKITDREKSFLFNYLLEGNLEPNKRKVANDKNQNLFIREDVRSYKTNVFVIVESFFNYGFIP